MKSGYLEYPFLQKYGKDSYEMGAKKNTGLLRCLVYSFTLQFSSLKPLFTLFKYTVANVIKKTGQNKFNFR